MEVGGLPKGELVRCMPYRPQVTVGVGYILPEGSAGVVRRVRGERGKELEGLW